MHASRVDALVLIAHGSRDPRWTAPIEAVALRLREARPGLAVHLAYLEHTEPEPAQLFMQLAAAGHHLIALAPLFLGIGAHARADIANLVEAARRAHPALQLTVLAAAGELPHVQQALAHALLESIDLI